MATYFTLTLTPKEREAVLEMINMNHTKHIEYLRRRKGGYDNFKMFERAVNKIANSKSVEA